MTSVVDSLETDNVVAVVGSDDHEVAIDRLDALAANRDAVLWERASVTLDESANGHVDGGTDR